MEEVKIILVEFVLQDQVEYMAVVAVAWGTELLALLISVQVAAVLYVLFGVQVVVIQVQM
jgi:hypothetical protein